MADIAGLLSSAADTFGLSYDSNRRIMYGPVNGFTFAVIATATNARYYSVYFHAARDGSPLTAADGKQIAKDSNKLVQYVKPSGAAVSFFVVKVNKDEAANTQNLADALAYLANKFANRGYVNTCEHCRRPVETAPCAVGNGIRFLCSDCYETVSSDLTERAHVEAETPANMAAGIVGALGGALLGAIVVVIFGRLGYVTALSGLIAAVCALKGYELLAKKMSVKGAIIACVAMLAMIYLGHRADWALEVASYFEVDFFTAFRAIPMLIREGAIEMGNYLRGLLMVYFFAIVGALPTIINSLKGQKNKYSVERLG